MLFDAVVVDVTVQADTPIVDHTLEEAVRKGLLDENSLVIAIEREDRVLTPHGTTAVQPDDIVTVLCPDGDIDGVLFVFVGEELLQSTDSA